MLTLKTLCKFSRNEFYDFRDSNIGAKFLYKLKPSAHMTIEWHEQNYINIREKEITSRKKPYLHQAIDCNDLLLIYIY